MSKTIQLEPAVPGKRPRYTPDQKRALLDEATRAGKSMAIVAREYSVAPSLLFQWKRVMDDATKRNLSATRK